MKKNKTITVRTYSDYKGSEYPLSFFLDDVEIHVAEVIDRYYNPDENIFKVKSVDGKVYILGYNTISDEWTIRSVARELQ